MEMKKPLILLLCLGLGFAACTVKAVGDPEKPITIKAHIVVDIREMKNTATGIEDMIAEEAVTQASAVQSAKPTVLSLAGKWFGPRIAYAAGGYDLKEVTPDIQLALEGRKNRYRDLMTYKAVGKVGEDNEGHVKDFSGEKKVQDIVIGENADREVIYKAIVKQNGLPRNAIHTVRSVFAEVQRNKLNPGEKMQMPNGEWVTKS